MAEVSILLRVYFPIFYSFFDVAATMTILMNQKATSKTLKMLIPVSRPRIPPKICYFIKSI